MQTLIVILVTIIQFKIIIFTRIRNNSIIIKEPKHNKLIPIRIIIKDILLYHIRNSSQDINNKKELNSHSNHRNNIIISYLNIILKKVN